MRMANEQGQRVYYNCVEKHGKIRYVVKAIGGHKLRGRDKQLTSSHASALSSVRKVRLPGTGRADGWYATVGVPCTDWLKVYAKYDAYRDQGNWESTRTMYALIPNFQLHKNLMFQVQFNHIHDRLAADHNYNEVWAELYVRF